MKIIRTENKLCLCCMEKHDVHLVEVKDTTTYLGEKVSYISRYEYCTVADEFLSTEEMITNNYLSMRNAYDELIHEQNIQ